MLVKNNAGSNNRATAAKQPGHPDCLAQAVAPTVVGKRAIRKSGVKQARGDPDRGLSILTAAWIGLCRVLSGAWHCQCRAASMAGWMPSPRRGSTQFQWLANPGLRYRSTADAPGVRSVRNCAGPMVRSLHCCRAGWLGQARRSSRSGRDSVRFFDTDGQKEPSAHPISSPACSSNPGYPGLLPAPVRKPGCFGSGRNGA